MDLMTWRKLTQSKDDPSGGVRPRKRLSNGKQKLKLKERSGYLSHLSCCDWNTSEISTLRISSEYFY